MKTKLLLVCFCCIFVFSSFAAKSPVGVATMQSDEEAPAVAYNWELDEFLVVWHEDRSGNGNIDIYGRIMGSDGVAKTAAFKITRDTSDQMYPDADFNRLDNEYLVVWQDNRNGKPDIMAARLDVNGAKVDPQITYKNTADSTIIVSNQDDEQERPRVAHNFTDNSYLVVWQDSRNDTGSAMVYIPMWDIYCQHLDNTGEILAPSITLLPSVNYPVASGTVPLGMDFYDDASERHPDVAYHGSEGTELNEWLVVYERYHMEAGSRIYATRINGPTGYHLNSYGEEFPKVNENPLVKASIVPIFYLPFWCEGIPVGFPEVPTDPTDPYPGNPTQYEPHVISNSVYTPDILLKTNAPIETMYPVPEFLITWTDYRNSQMGENPDIYCQRVGYFPDSTAIQMGLKQSASGDSCFTSVLLDSLGDPAKVMSNWIEWANYPVTNNPKVQGYEDLAFNQITGHYLVVWNDWRISEWDGMLIPSPQSDIYGQLLYINPADSHLIWVDDKDNWHQDPSVNFPIIKTTEDEGNGRNPGLDFGVSQNEFMIAYEYDTGSDDVNDDIHATFFPDVYEPVALDLFTTNQPVQFSLSPNYPNPFNPCTAIQFSMDKNAHVELSIFDITGRKIRILVSETRDVGAYEITWDGMNHVNQPVASGLYLYQLKSEGRILTQKMSLIR